MVLSSLESNISKIILTSCRANSWCCHCRWQTCQRSLLHLAQPIHGAVIVEVKHLKSHPCILQSKLMVLSLLVANMSKNILTSCRAQSWFCRCWWQIWWQRCWTSSFTSCRASIMVLSLGSSMSKAHPCRATKSSCTIWLWHCWRRVLHSQSQCIVFTWPRPGTFLFSGVYQNIFLWWSQAGVQALLVSLLRDITW